MPIKYTEFDFFEKFKNYNCIKEEFVTWNKNNLLNSQKTEIEKTKENVEITVGEESANKNE